MSHADAKPAPPWPAHADGRPKKVGEMTREERRVQFKVAAKRVQAELEHPVTRAAIERVIGEDS